MNTPSGILKKIELTNVGPTNNAKALFAPGLNIITGDNGLGKTFLMDCAWYALTDTWAGNIALPKYASESKRAIVAYTIGSTQSHNDINGEITFNKTNSEWLRKPQNGIMKGAAVYSLVDNSYALWDSAEKCYAPGAEAHIVSDKQVWNGSESFPDGLISDWLTWQKNQDIYPFEVFKTILKAVSPPEMGKLYPGEPMSAPDGKILPTIVFPYATVPVVYASAGIKRVITLAYLIVKAWIQHKALSAEENTNMVVIIDEIEAHIHPKWQRTILGALIEIQKNLAPKANVQFIISTHSPLILASAEAVFDSDRDKLFRVRLSDSKTDAIIQEEDFIKYGQINAWLTSPVFDLAQARSVEAEKAIEYAKHLQLEDSPKPEEIRKAHEMLIRYLSQTDPFWPRWIYFAEQNGVEV